MLRTCFNDRIRWFDNINRCLMIRRSHVNVGIQMKEFNDAKQFQKALACFDQCQPKNLNELPSIVLTQVLKACTKVQDYRRALDIYNRLSPQTANDPSIIASMIHLHSEISFGSNSRKPWLLIAVFQCRMAM